MNDYAYLCACGRRLGLHRWLTNECPNPRWKAGNGQRQWLEECFRPAALERRMA